MTPCHGVARRHGSRSLCRWTSDLGGLAPFCSDSIRRRVYRSRKGRASAHFGQHSLLCSRRCFETVPLTVLSLRLYVFTEVDGNGGGNFPLSRVSPQPPPRAHTEREVRAHCTYTNTMKCNSTVHPIERAALHGTHGFTSGGALVGGCRYMRA